MTGNYAYLGRSDFYMHGHTYQLTVHQTIFGRVKIEIRRGRGDEALYGSKRTYRNTEAFNKEWEKAYAKESY